MLNNMFDIDTINTINAEEQKMTEQGAYNNHKQIGNYPSEIPY